MYIKFNATVISTETWYWVTVGAYEVTLILCFSLSNNPSTFPTLMHPFISDFHPFFFFFLTWISFISSSISSFCPGANHRAVEGATGKGGKRKRRWDGVQQEGAEGPERESVPFAGWPGRSWGREHTDKHTLYSTYYMCCLLSHRNICSSPRLSSCHFDWTDLGSSQGLGTEGQQW